MYYKYIAISHKWIRTKAIRQHHSLPKYVKLIVSFFNIIRFSHTDATLIHGDITPMTQVTVKQVVRPGLPMGSRTFVLGPLSSEKFKKISLIM